MWMTPEHNKRIDASEFKLLPANWQAGASEETDQVHLHQRIFHESKMTKENFKSDNSRINHWRKPLISFHTIMAPPRSYLASLLFFLLSLVFLFLAAMQKKSITAKAILAFKPNWTVNPPAKDWDEESKAKKKSTSRTGLRFLFSGRPRCSLWCWTQKKKQKNKLSHPFCEGEAGEV